MCTMCKLTGSEKAGHKDFGNVLRANLKGHAWRISVQASAGEQVTMTSLSVTEATEIEWPRRTWGHAAREKLDGK